MQKGRIFGMVILFITALIWGCAFVAQKQGMESIEPFTFCAVRFLLSAVFLFFVILIRDIFIKKELTVKKINTPSFKKVLIGGILCGLALTVAANFQQVALIDATVGKSGFITTLYIVLVPLFGIFIKKKVKYVEWISVIIAVISLAFLCLKKEDFTNGQIISIADLYLLICAVFFSLQILFIDHFSKDCDCVVLAFIQFTITGTLSAILMFIFEKPNIEAILDVSIPIAYAGIASGGIAYTFQMIGQKYTKPVIASVIMSFESVIALVAGAILMSEELSNQELIGCLLMFIAILVPQIPWTKIFNRKGKVSN